MGRAWSSCAVAWKDFNLVAGGRSTLLIKLVTYGALFAFAFALNAYMQGLQMSFIDWSDTFKFMGASTMVIATLAFVVEMSLYCNRMFHQELKANTFTTLLMLPLSVPRLIAEKAAGTLLALIPCITMFLVGLALISLEPAKDPTPTYIAEIIFTSGFLTTALVVVFFWHLIVYLSLVLKWGALVASIACMLLLYFLGVVFLTFASLFLATIAGGINIRYTWMLLVAIDGSFVLGIVLLQAAIVNRVHALGTK
jgi:hypothetical protein